MTLIHTGCKNQYGQFMDRIENEPILSDVSISDVRFLRPDLGYCIHVKLSNVGAQVRTEWGYTLTVKDQMGLSLSTGYPCSAYDFADKLEKLASSIRETLKTWTGDTERKEHQTVWMCNQCEAELLTGIPKPAKAKQGFLNHLMNATEVGGLKAECPKCGKEWDFDPKFGVRYWK